MTICKILNKRSSSTNGWSKEDSIVEITIENEDEGNLRFMFSKFNTIEIRKKDLLTLKEELDRFLNE